MQPQYGATNLSCLEHVDISVLATPFNVSVEEDGPRGTAKQRYQTYLLTQTVDSRGRTVSKEACDDNTTIRMTITRKDFMVNHHVYRVESIVSLFTKLLGAVAGVVNAVNGVVGAYFAALKWWRRRKRKEEVALVVLTVDDADTGSWAAQREWNRKSSERIDNSEAQLKEWKARHEKSEAQHQEWKGRIERLEADLLRANI